MLHTLRLAWRSLKRRPGFSALAVLTIALGAGANAAVSAFAYGILLRPMPFAEPERLVAVWPNHFMSQVDLRYLRDHAADLSRISAVAPGWTFSLTGAGEPSRVTVDRVAGDFFETLGTPPYLGRLIRAHEETPGAPRVLALSYRYWRARFGGDPSVIGRTVKLDDEPHEIVAVMPPAFEVFTTRADAWAPLPADHAAFYDRLSFSLLVGRLADRTTVEVADRRFRDLIPMMRRDLNYAASYGRDARLEDLRTATTGDVRTSLLVLAAAVTFMLLIAGANLGTLLVAAGAARAREFAVHAAIGASRGALIRLQLIEGIVLAAIGAGLGLGVAAAGMPALLRLLPRDTPRIADIHIDAIVASGVVAAALLVALVFAIAPSLSAGRRLSATLLRQGASTESRAARHTRGVLVSVQIALALVLTIGAGLMLRTLWHLNRVDAGIDVDHVLTLRLQPTSSGDKGAAAAISYYDQVLQQLESLPGVRAAGAIQHLPFSGTAWVDAYEVEGHPVAAGEARPTAGLKVVAGRYFAAVRQPLLAGRFFTAADRRAPTLTIIVNAALAAKYLGAPAAAVGQRIRMGRVPGEWKTIIGVVGNVRTQSLASPPEPELYTAFDGRGIQALMIAVGTDGDPLAIAGAAREAVWSIDRNVPVADLQTMRTMVGLTLAQPQLLLTLLTAFALAGLALGGIGVYGVVAFGVLRRRREIGIRMALGAGRASIVRLMLGESAGYAAAGLGAGAILALASNRVMKSLLFEVSSTDAATYVVLAAAVAMLVVLASYIPARRAASINPAETLRSV